MIVKRRLASIYVVDDNGEFADSLTCLLHANGFPAYAYLSGQAFLTNLPTLVPGIIMLDLKMPGMDGIGVLQELKSADLDWPIVIMTGHGDVALAVRCIQQGASEFIEKPFDETRLLDVLDEAIDLLHSRTLARQESARCKELLGSLTKREREVLAKLTLGLTNKQIAQELDLSTRTIEMHRAKLVRRLGVRTSFDAIRLALKQPSPGAK